MAETYVRNSSAFQQANQIFVNVSGTYQEVNEAYANVSGTYKLIFSAFEATSFVTLSSGSGTFTVPDNANAIHIQAAVGGGGGAAGGADYDKAGGESAGAGGGSGAYVSDKIFSVTEGETLTYSIGSGGSGGNQTSNFKQPRMQVMVHQQLYQVQVQDLYSHLVEVEDLQVQVEVCKGPLRTNTAGTPGSATVSSSVSTGTFRDSDGVTKNVNTNTSGPAGTFNDSGDGATGSLSGSGNCGGDNCRIWIFWS